MRWKRREFAAPLPVQLAPSAAISGPASLSLVADSPVAFAGTRHAGGRVVGGHVRRVGADRLLATGLAPSARAIAVDATQKQPVLASIEVGAGRTV